MTEAVMTGKIVFRGEVKTLSPLHVGCGGGSRSDLDILLDENKKPFIPATSFLGALRSASNPDKMLKAAFQSVWGYADDDDGQQSAVYCSDLRCTGHSPSTVIRDGVAIDSKTGIAKDQAKYDYEVVESGTSFALNMEFSYNASNQAPVMNMAATIYALLKEQAVRIGAKTTSGFGKIELCEENTRCYHFDFSQESHVFHWLREESWEENRIAPAALGQPLELKNTPFSLEASFWLKNSLIVRAYSTDPLQPDAVHIQAGGKHVLPGTSLKGAIRARAERIVNTLGQSKTIIPSLFGEVNEEARTAHKGRIRVEETLLPDFVAEMQSRIKIDRFTGGTVESALFDTMPLFSVGEKPERSPDEKIIRLNIQIEHCREHEAGLLLLVLKDLWTGDLAVGGEKSIGRGVFEGIQARIDWKGESMQFGETLAPLSSEQKTRLQGYVDALHSYNPQRAEEANHDDD